VIVSKEVSFLVGTIGTFLGDIEDIFWQYFGDFNLYFWVEKFVASFIFFNLEFNVSAVDLMVN
jgi:hypothetical protein